MYGSILGSLGIFILIMSYLALDSSNRTPGIAALMPVLGTALIIISPRSSLSSKILSNKPLVQIGLVSYSLYLWHQPILSFGHQASKSFFTTVILLLLISAVSFLTWKYIEIPFRSKAFIKDSFVLPSSVAALFFLGFTGWFIFSNNGFIEQFPIYTNNLSSNKWESNKNVNENCIKQYGGDQYCLVNDLSAEVTDVLIGDSHANHFYHGLAERLNLDGRNLLMIGAGACPPLIDIDMGFHYEHGKRLKCLERINEEYLSLLKSETVQRVYLAFEQDTMFDERLDFIDTRGEIDFAQNRGDAIFSAVMRTIKYSQSNGKSVSIIMSLPNNTHADFLKCLLDGKTENECVRVWAVKKINEQYIRLLERIKEQGVNIIDTSFALDKFPYISENTYLYRDGTHLSLDGSRFVAFI